MRVGLIRVLSTCDVRLLRTHGTALEAAFGFDVVTRCIEDQPYGVHDAESLAAAAPKVVRLALELAPHVDALIISCAADPALAETRSVVDIPVIGAGSAAAATALAFGGTVGVLGLNGSAPGPIADALGERMLLLDGPASVHRSNHFLTPTGVFDTLSAAQLLADAGADVIVQASTGLTSIGMASELRRRLRIPVVDAVMAAGSMVVSGLPTRQLITA